MINRKIFSERLKALRKEHNLTSVSIASSLNITKQSVHGWESMKTVPSADNLAELADLLDCSIDYLAGRTDNSKINK